MSGLREGFIEALLSAGVHTESDDDRYYCGQVADAVLGVLAEHADTQLVRT